MERDADIHGLTYTTSDQSDYAFRHARSALRIRRGRVASKPTSAVLLLQQHRAHIAEEFVRVIVSRHA